MGFITAGLFAFNLQGVSGSILQMINHGILTGALFQMVGFFYERTHTRQIKDYGGFARPMPVAAAFFSLFVMGSLGLPGLNGFIGEFLILLGVFQYAKVYAVIASIGIILGAGYLLWMYQRTMFQELKNDKWLKLKDLNAREVFTLVPLAALALFIGLYPKPLLVMIEAPAQNILAQVAPYMAEKQSLIHLASTFLGGK
jgi:NADH-quinone oxidoreductase subunit M